MFAFQSILMYKLSNRIDYKNNKIWADNVTFIKVGDDLSLHNKQLTQLVFSFPEYLN